MHDYKIIFESNENPELQDSVYRLSLAVNNYVAIFTSAAYLQALDDVIDGIDAFTTLPEI